MGERGDTDYEDLLVGLHRTVILQGCVEYGSDMILHNEDGFKWQDAVPQDSTTTAIAESYEALDISTALEKLGSM